MKQAMNKPTIGSDPFLAQFEVEILTDDDDCADFSANTSVAVRRPREFASKITLVKEETTDDE
jgi:hypothetical protein